MKLNQDEKAGLVRARTENPTLSQRKLAKAIYDNYSGYGFSGYRTTGGIYSAVRTYDRNVKAAQTTMKSRRRSVAA